MIKITKVFIKLNMILGSILIWPLFLGAYLLYRLDSAEKPEDLNSVGIISLFFLGIIPGILILNIKQCDLIEKTTSNERLSYDSCMWIVYALVIDSLLWTVFLDIIGLNLFLEITGLAKYTLEYNMKRNIDTYQLCFSWVVFEFGFMFFIWAINRNKKYSSTNTILMIFMALISLFSCIFSAIAYLPVVFTLSFILFIWLIFMLIRFRDYKKINNVVRKTICVKTKANETKSLANKEIADKSKQLNNKKQNDADIFKKLSELKELYDSNIINEEEYMNIKNELINKMFNLK